MSISEQDRYELHAALRGALGEKQAASLMASLPPTGWADVATKEDLLQLEARLMALLGAEVAGVHTGMAGVRTEMAEVRTELRTGMAELRTEMAELRTDVADRLRAQMQVMVGSFIGVATVMVAAVRL